VVEKQARKRSWNSRGLNGLTNHGLIQRRGFESEMELWRGLDDRPAATDKMENRTPGSKYKKQ
jgi:hypothetical protein